MAIDFEAEGLLEGLEGEARDARLKLLEQLESDGAELDELKRAAKEGRLALLPVERELEGGGKRYTPEEVAEQSNLDPELLARVWRAMGMPDLEPGEKTLTEQDLAGAKAGARFIEAGIGEDRFLEATRVMSQAMSGVAATVSETFAEALLEPGDTEYDVGLRFAEASRELMPHVDEVVLHMQRVHLRQRARSAMVGQEQLAAGTLPGASEVCVCFADLVGFTKLGERLPAEELGGVAGRLAELAGDVAERPVRVVKTIGDAAMLVSEEADPLLDAALRLVDAGEEQEETFPQVHAGLDRGEALQRGGDWYGSPVNRASRITDFAKAGSVVASEGLREATEGDYRWSFAGKKRLKGVKGELVLFRARPPERGDGEA